MALAVGVLLHTTAADPVRAAIAVVGLFGLVYVLARVVSSLER